MAPDRPHHRLLTRTTVALAAVVLGVGTVACSSDGDSTTATTSAQQAYCAAGNQLRSDVTALGDLDLLAEGTNGLTSALQAIDDDLAQLEDSADAAASDQIDALKTAVSDLSDAVSGLGDGISRENLSSLQTAVSDVTSSASAVYDTLTDCP